MKYSSWLVLFKLTTTGESLGSGAKVICTEGGWQIQNSKGPHQQLLPCVKDLRCKVSI